MAHSDIPIIMVHCMSGLPLYAGLAMVQVRRVNPDARFYLITDEPGRHNPNISVVRADEFKASSDAFRSIFFHLGPRPFEIERFCIERWFLTRDLMRREQLDRCFCMDSDVLLFNSVEQLFKPFRSLDFTVLNGISWGTVFITRDVLEHFCDYIMKVYSRDAEEWPLFADRIGFSTPYAKLLPVSDMVHVTQFVERHGTRYQFAEQAQVIDSHLIDPNINIAAPDCVMEGDFKKVVWRDGLPYGELASTGAPVRFDLLHYQGVQAKGLVQDHFNMFATLHGELNSMQLLGV